MYLGGIQKNIQNRNITVQKLQYVCNFTTIYFDYILTICVYHQRGRAWEFVRKL